MEDIDRLLCKGNATVYIHSITSKSAFKVLLEEKFKSIIKIYFKYQKYAYLLSRMAPFRIVQIILLDCNYYLFIYVLFLFQYCHLNL